MDLESESPLQQALRAVLRGDVSRIPEIFGADHASLRAEAAALGEPLIATRAAVAEVLRGLHDGRLEAVDARRWASFVRHGHGPGLTEPFRPVDIEYEAEGEDAIVEAIARLTELGDLVDGIIGDEEATELLSALGGRAAGA